jgi:amidase
MPPITVLSATELAAKARSGELSVTEIVEAHIERIEQVNPRLNAVVTPLFEQARTAATAADAVRAAGQELPPLFGVPVTIKDSLDVADAPATCGMLARRDRIAPRDAAVVAAMRSAGAIILGKTNTPEVCWAQETTNLLYGRTNNPWNLNHTVGGSTGGEAAIIAAGGSPLGMGSDISGSIRMPAAFTGIVGLRPTSARLDETGHYPYATGRLADLEAVGPMARCVEDVALAFAVLTDSPYIRPDPALLAGQKVGFWFNNGLKFAEASIRSGVIKAVAALRDAGMQPIQKGAPLRAFFAEIGWLAYLDHDARKAIDEAFMAGSMREEIARHVQGKPTVSGEALHYWNASLLSAVVERFFDGVRWRERLYEQFLERVGEGGVIVCPIHPTPAPHHGWQRFAPLLTIAYQQWVNLAGLPGLTVPTGLAPNGLPTAVQIVGARGREDVVLAAGMAVQKALGVGVQPTM